MFSVITVLAGDFKNGKGSQFVGDSFYMEKKPKDFFGWLFVGFREKINVSSVIEIDLASTENVSSLFGSLAGGAVGGMILGPVGLLAGLLTGGQKQRVTFVCKFKDGRKFLGSTDSKTWTAIMAARF